VTSIAQLAFYGCSGLNKVTIPSSVASIGDYAFCMCSSLTDIYVHSSTPMEIFADTFSYYDTSTLHVPVGSLHEYSTAQFWKKFLHIVDDIAVSAILSPKADEEPQQIFDVNGRSIKHLIPGFNIIKYKNGEVKKVYIQAHF
jgi:hypothetical protein